MLSIGVKVGQNGALNSADRAYSSNALLVHAFTRRDFHVLTWSSVVPL